MTVSDETTPVVKHKKWRKSRKNQNSGSCASSSPSTPRSLHPDAVFGQPLEKCPTGESDVSFSKKCRFYKKKLTLNMSLELL